MRAMPFWQESHGSDATPCAAPPRGQTSYCPLDHAVEVASHVKALFPFVTNKSLRVVDMFLKSLPVILTCLQNRDRG